MGIRTRMQHPPWATRSSRNRLNTLGTRKKTWAERADDATFVHITDFMTIHLKRVSILITISSNVRKQRASEGFNCFRVKSGAFSISASQYENTLFFYFFFYRYITSQKYCTKCRVWWPVYGVNMPLLPRLSILRAYYPHTWCSSQTQYSCTRHQTEFLSFPLCFCYIS